MTLAATASWNESRRLTAPAAILLASTMCLSGGLAPWRETLGGETTSAQHVTVTGTVTDAEGQAVADADVYFVYTAEAKANVTKTDASGIWSFKLTEEPRMDLRVLVFKAGHAIGIASKSIHRFMAADERIGFGDTVDLPVQLGQSAQLHLRIVDDQGVPVKGARVGLNGVSQTGGTDQFYAEDAFVPELNWTADADGNVTLGSMMADHSVGLLVETPQHGIQSFGVDVRRAAERVVVKLRPVCRVEVAVSSEDGSELADREIMVYSTAVREPQPESKQPNDTPITEIQSWGGQLRLRTDPSGRASGVSPAGALSIRVKHRTDGRQFSPSRLTLQGQPGQSVSVPIRLQTGTKVTGRVQTLDDEPLADVRLEVSESEVRSRGDGTYEAWGPADQQIGVRILGIPDGFAFPYDLDFYIPAPEKSSAATTERMARPIILRKATPIAGRVIDESGQPVTGAQVIASWVQQHEFQSYFTRKSDKATSDANGHFRLKRVFPDVDVIVTAQTTDMCALEATSLHSSSPQEVQLTVSPEGWVPLIGSVRDVDGNAVPNATLKVMAATLAPRGHNYGSRPVLWNSQETFAAEANGSFQSPGKVPRFGQYSMTISAPGYLAVETPYLSPPKQGAALDLGVSRLMKSRTVAGIVRDSSGRSVSGAEVWSWAAQSTGGRSHLKRTTTTTNDAGRFMLENVHPASAVALVSKESCRPTGCALPSGAAEVAAILYRLDDPLPPEHAVHPSTLNDARRFASAEKMLDAVLVDQRNSNYFHGEILAMLVRSNPAAAQAELAKTKSPEVRARTLAQLGELQDALAEVESISDAYRRAYCRFEIADLTNDPIEARDLLAAALLDAQSIERPDRRVLVVASIAERFSGLGDHERAATLLREERPRAEALSAQEWPGFARGYFAAQLARVEPEVALRMASEAEADDQTRHYQNIAHVLAATNPAKAEEALSRIGQHRYVNDPAVRVAYRMAAVDLPRAIRLVDMMDVQRGPVEQARGCGVMAWAIREQDPRRARELLQRAFSSIEAQHRGAGSRTDEIFGAGMELLRLAEDVDPQRLTDYFWLVVSLHPGPTGGAWSPDEAPRSDAEQQARLALLLAMYTAMPELQGQIMEPVFAFWESQLGTKSLHFTDHEGTFMAMALCDPERATDWGLRFHAQLDEKHRHYIPQPWEVIGKTLTRDRAAIGESITREVFHRWVIDQFDL